MFVFWDSYINESIEQFTIYDNPPSTQTKSCWPREQGYTGQGDLW